MVTLTKTIDYRTHTYRGMRINGCIMYIAIHNQNKGDEPINITAEEVSIGSACMVKLS